MASRLFEGSLLSWMFWALRVFALVVSSIRYLYLYLCVAAVNWPGDVAFERRKTRPTGLLGPVQQQPDGHRTAAPLRVIQTRHTHVFCPASARKNATDANLRRFAASSAR